MLFVRGVIFVSLTLLTNNLLCQLFLSFAYVIILHISIKSSFKIAKFFLINPKITHKEFINLIGEIKKVSRKITRHSIKLAPIEWIIFPWIISALGEVPFLWTIKLKNLVWLKIDGLRF